MKFVRDIFLATFAGVAGLNAPGWYGPDDRKRFNDFNGVLAVTLVQYFLLHAALVVVSWWIPGVYPRTLAWPLVVAFALVALNYRWIIAQGAGKQHLRTRESQSHRYRKFINISALALAVAVTIAAFALRARPFP